MSPKYFRFLVGLVISGVENRDKLLLTDTDLKNLRSINARISRAEAWIKLWFTHKQNDETLEPAHNS
jgi:hypothetical protein